MKKEEMRFLKKVKKNKKVNLGGPGVTKTHGSVNRIKTRDKKRKKQIGLLKDSYKKRMMKIIPSFFLCEKSKHKFHKLIVKTEF
jgi:hypothetical protein